MDIMIEQIKNGGYLVDVWNEKEERERLYFATAEEVLAFLETNLD